MRLVQEEQQQPQFRGRYGLPTVLISAALIGIVGFALGSNVDELERPRYDSVNQELPEELDYSDVDEVYEALREKFAGELSEEELMQGLKRGLVDAAGDPFTEYLDVEQAQELQESLDGEFEGIGAEIGIRDDQLVIIAPIDGTPASDAGLQAGDAIVEIDEEVTDDLSVEQAVERIRGDAGSEVVLTIVRGDDEPQDVPIERAQIAVPSVETEMLDDDIGYIELVRFGRDSTEAFRQAATELRADGAEAIVLDVRNNPGGLLNAAVDISSEFLPSGATVVEERRQDEVISTEQAQGNGSLEGLSTKVLINQGSASGSEIIAGALRDNDVARLVGEQTFGKGSVQELVELRGGNVLRVTIANWYTPGEVNIEEEGIEPDYEVEMEPEDWDLEDDPVLERALELLRDS